LETNFTTTPSRVLTPSLHSLAVFLISRSIAGHRSHVAATMLQQRLHRQANTITMASCINQCSFHLTTAAVHISTPTHTRTQLICTPNPHTRTRLLVRTSSRTPSPDTRQSFLQADTASSNAE
jgi:hypothetical protein